MFGLNDLILIKCNAKADAVIVSQVSTVWS